MEGQHHSGVPFLSISISVLTVLLGLAEQWITYKDLMHTITLATIGGTVGWLMQRALNKLSDIIKRRINKTNKQQ
jgi:predicted membrane protein